MIKRKAFCLLSLCSLLLFASCAGDVAVKPPELVWPLPPEKPRIKFVDEIVGSLDAELRFEKMKKFLFGRPADRRFRKPFGVAAKNHIMYVTDLGAVWVFDFSNGKFRLYGIPDIKMPTGIALAEDGRIFVGDVVRGGVVVLDKKGKAIGEFGRKVLNTPSGITVDKRNKRLIVSDAKKHAVFVFDLHGKLLFQIGERGSGSGKFNFPYGVVSDNEGRIYVVDTGNFRLQIFTPEGAFIKSIGSVGATPGTFARPKGVAIDSDGHIYVLDAAFGNFQIFDFEGNTLLAVGRPGREVGEFFLPSSIFNDEKDEIYVVDQVNRRVQIFQYLKEE